jgi:murein L,D-transpeptidase YafK
MTFRQMVLRRVSKFALAAACLGFLAACDERGTEGLNGRAFAPIPSDTLALMETKGVTSDAPILIRAYKKEAELEIWKKKPDGQYVYLKTFPMCRWSGQLGPKIHAGDRQVPEGFYEITPGQMNPNSHYYLSFNVGYPNLYDRVHGATGGDIMVHGICSSAGCFSMTNEQIEEIYALAREAFNGGQRQIQMQALPFKMTAENLAKHRLDPHIAFWKMLKEGADHFEVTKREPAVGVCGKRYVFDVADASRLDPVAPCPTNLATNPQIEQDVAAKERQDDMQVAALVAKGVKPIELVYADGGQNPIFYSRVADVSRPEGLTQGPTEIVLDDSGKPLPPAVEMLSARLPSYARSSPVGGEMVASYAAAPQSVASASSQPFYTHLLGFSDNRPTASIAVEEPATPQVADVPLPPRRPGDAHVMAAAAEPGVSVAPQSAAAPVATADQPGLLDQTFYSRWLGLAPETAAPAPTPVAIDEPSRPQPADVPLPPRRQATAASVSPQARLEPAHNPHGALHDMVAGAQDALPPGFSAYSAIVRAGNQQD